jgi:hypothetical protein
MSILGTIESDLGSVFSDPGKLVTDLVDGLLPDKMKSLGDLAGGVVDVVLGKESQALSHFQDGLRDLPQLAADAPAAAATSTATAPAPEPDAADAQPTDLAGLLALPSNQFINAISSGAIPDGVANDPAALLQIQARVNDIAQMNQMMTSMMSALHQMQMSVAQNIRA